MQVVVVATTTMSMWYGLMKPLLLERQTYISQEVQNRGDNFFSSDIKNLSNNLGG